MPYKLTISELAEERRISLWKVKFDLHDEQVARSPALKKKTCMSEQKACKLKRTN